MAKAITAVNRYSGKKVGKMVLLPLLTGIKVRYGFTNLDLFESNGKWGVAGEINPKSRDISHAEVADSTSPGVKETMVPKVVLNFFVKKSIHKAVDTGGVSLWQHYVDQLKLQQNALNSMVIAKWLSNMDKFYGNPILGIQKEGRSKVGTAKQDQIRTQIYNKKASEFMASDNTLSIEKALSLAKDYYKDKAILHLLDQAGGGE